MPKQIIESERGTVRLLTTADLGKQLQLSKRTISRMLSAGELPPPVRIGRLVRWREADIAQFIERLIDQKPQSSYNRETVQTYPTHRLRKR